MLQRQREQQQTAARSPVRWQWRTDWQLRLPDAVAAALVAAQTAPEAPLTWYGKLGLAHTCHKGDEIVTR